MLGFIMKPLDITRLMNQKTWMHPTDSGLLEVLGNPNQRRIEEG